MSVTTIPSHLSFVRILARHLLDQSRQDPVALSSAQIFLPTRRSRRALQTAFLQESAGSALLLPRLSMLGQGEDDAPSFDEGAQALAEIPPAISPLRRQMLLIKLIRKKDDTLSYDQMVDLATALAGLLDQVQIEGADFANLKNLAPENLAEHWKETLRFLEIVTSLWPGVLKEEGNFLDPAERRNRVLAAQAQKWLKNPPTTPIIIAGSTGSMPAVAALMDVVRQLPGGMVVLPGLDRRLDNDAWESISQTHPQYGMKRLLDKFGLRREDVSVLGQDTPSPRVRLLNEAMRPAQTTQSWRSLTKEEVGTESVHHLSRLDLDTEQEEASVIALRLRAVLEEKEKTALFVTPDRMLAMRVCAMLKRWDVDVNDSAGSPLYTTRVGSFLQSMLESAVPNAQAIACLSFLKHPLCAVGCSLGLCRTRARSVEKCVWRGVAPSHGWRGAASLIDDPLLSEWVSGIADSFAVMHQTWDQPLPLSERIDQHIACAEQFATTDEESGSNRLWAGPEGDAAAAWFAQWKTATHDFDALTGDAYLSLFRAMIRAVSVPSMPDVHPRLNILGTLEARLQSADVVILGGLNEGTWPTDVGYDPWLSRPMQVDFGLPVPERLIGLSAHDFVQLASKGDVLMTRAKSVSRQPTVPSRFLLQLDAVLQAVGFASGNDCLKPALPWKAWTVKMDEPSTIEPCARPNPVPPVDNRPRTLSVTDIAVWKKNPYALYAKHILKLRKLDPIDMDVGASDCGNLIHKSLELFVKENPQIITDQTLDALISIGRTVFEPFIDRPQVEAFWWPRFVRNATAFVDEMKSLRQTGTTVVGAEVSAQMDFAHGAFSLKGRADRIDKKADGTLSIIDYKTGHVPSGDDVRNGYEPQLTLLAAMAMNGFFKGIAAHDVGEVCYWGLLSRGEAIKITEIAKDLPSLVDDSRAQLEELIAAYQDPSRSYPVIHSGAHALKYDDYVHLSRQAEWAVVEENDE